MCAIAGTYPPSLRAGIHPAEFSHGLQEIHTIMFRLTFVTRTVIAPPAWPGCNPIFAVQRSPNTIRQFRATIRLSQHVPSPHARTFSQKLLIVAGGEQDRDTWETLANSLGEHQPVHAALASLLVLPRSCRSRSSPQSSSSRSFALLAPAPRAGAQYCRCVGLV